MRVPYEYAIDPGRAPDRTRRADQRRRVALLPAARLPARPAPTCTPTGCCALDPDADVDGVRGALTAWEATCAGRTAPAREMKLGERFRWLVAPRSTILQAGPVHMGLAADPAAELDRLVELLVR